MKYKNTTNKKSTFLLRIITISIVAISLLNSCEDLEQEPLGTTSPQNFFESSDQIMGVFVQPYSFIQTHVYQVHFALQEFTTDEAVVPVRFGFIDQEGQWLRFHRHTWTVDDLWIEFEWENMFQGIGFSNQFLNDIKKVEFASFDLPISKEQMVAEIRMVRALHYYWALSSFGNIPIVTESNMEEINPPTKSRTEVFEFIEKEIKESMPNLSEKGDPGWYGHFTKSAAQALLAKLYLNAEVFTGTPRWEEAITAIDFVLNADFSLDPKWNDPFQLNNENSDENIFVVPFDASNAQQFNFMQQNFHENILFDKYKVDWFGWHKISTQESFFNLYQSNDQRINQWAVGPQTFINEDGEEQPVLTWGGEPMVVTPEIDKLVNNGGGEAQGVMNKKYDLLVRARPAQSNDYVIFRLADLILMKAEALMRLNGGNATSEAVRLVNGVRERAFQSDDANFTTSSLTMEMLLDERGRELAYELHRREDMIRFGAFQKSWWEKPASAEFLELFPIPLSALNANPNLEQNPGY